MNMVKGDVEAAGEVSAEREALEESAAGNHPFGDLERGRELAETAAGAEGGEEGRGPGVGSDFYGDDGYRAEDDPEYLEHLRSQVGSEEGGEPAEPVQIVRGPEAEAGASRGGLEEPRVEASDSDGTPEELATEPGRAAAEDRVIEASVDGQGETDVRESDPPAGGQGFGSVRGAADAELGVGDELRRVIGESMEAAWPRVTGQIASAHGELDRKVDAALGSLNSAVGKLNDAEVGRLLAGVERLEKLLRVERADGTRSKTVKLEKRQRWLFRLAGVAAPCLVAVGMAAPLVFGLGQGGKDETNGWKDIVWKAHGVRIAECIEKATNEGVEVPCRIVARAWRKAE